MTKTYQLEGYEGEIIDFRVEGELQERRTGAITFPPMGEVDIQVDLEDVEEADGFRAILDTSIVELTIPGLPTFEVKVHGHEASEDGHQQTLHVEILGQPFTCQLCLGEKTVLLLVGGVEERIHCGACDGTGKWTVQKAEHWLKASKGSHGPPWRMEPKK